MYTSVKRCFGLAVSLLASILLIAQEKADHLVLTEVFLDKAQPAATWIEVYNPTARTLILERVRISHIKTINVLDQSIQDKGGMSVPAGGFVVLCADIGQFKSSYGKTIEPIEVKALASLTSGGFITVTTKTAVEYRGMIVRYGVPTMSSHVQPLAGRDVVPFAKGGRSHTRTVTRAATGVEVSDFSESLPTPGR